MSDGSAPDPEALLRQLAELRAQLDEANETLDAIRNGEVDAVVVGGAAGQIVYTLENADRPYRVLVERMQEGAVTLTADGAILYCNHSFSLLIGQRFEQIVGSNLVDHVRDRGQLVRMLADQARAQSTELALLAADGARVPVNLSIVELNAEEGAPRMFCAIVTDLSENYARAAELTQTNERLHREIAERGRAERGLAIALDAADMGSWEIALDGEATVPSERHNAIFGLEGTARRWSLADLLDHILPEDRAEVAAAFTTARLSGTLEFEKRITRASDGASRWVYVKGRAAEERRPATRFAGIVLDVTDQRLIDEQLRQAQKMEAIGQLTGGIAHDFNNLLMAVMSSLTLLRKRLPADPAAARLIDNAMQGAERGASLTQRMLAFARRQDLVAEQVDVAVLVEGMKDLVERTLGPAWALELAFPEDLPAVLADANQVEMALLNLAVNARDAMPDGGTIRIEAELRRGAEVLAAGLAPGAYIALSVVDTGEGMDAATLAKATEPFFTTKGIGKGTGLGLSMVHGLAEQLGGAFTLRSKPSQGTRATLWLPVTLAETLAIAAPNTAESDETPLGRLKVLAVDDDMLILMNTVEFLEDMGHEVLEAGSGEAAIALLRSHPDIDILITDQAMPKMTGTQLADLVTAERGDLPIILASGYGDVPPGAQSRIVKLGKPFSQDMLEQALNQALGGGR